MDALAMFAGVRLVPVVVIDDDACAVPLASALAEAGVTAIEITLRTPAALPAIEAIAATVPTMLVGAGSVRKTEQVAEAMSAGAEFLVSPGSSKLLLKAVADAGVPFVPGAATASEVLALAAFGYQLVKFFPAELSGGVKMLRALSDPIPEARFFPTGGITAVLAPDYLALPAVACVGGSWFVPRDLLGDRKFAEIANLTKAAVRLANG